MEDIFTIEFPNTIPDRALETLQAEIKQIDAVEDSDSMDARSVDPQSLMMWVQVAAGTLGVISTAVPLIEKVINMVRGKGLKGVKLGFADGFTVSIDEVSSAKDLEIVLKNLRQQPG